MNALGYLSIEGIIPSHSTTFLVFSFSVHKDLAVEISYFFIFCRRLFYRVELMVFGRRLTHVTEVSFLTQFWLLSGTTRVKQLIFGSNPLIKFGRHQLQFITESIF